MSGPRERYSTAFWDYAPLPGELFRGENCVCLELQLVTANDLVRYRDQDSCPLEDFANFYGGYSAGSQKAEEFRSMFACH